MKQNQSNNEQSKNKKPLTGLFRDEEEVRTRGEELLFEILSPYVSIGRDSKTLHLKEEVFNSKFWYPVLFLFLGRLAMCSLDVIKDASIGQSEVIAFLKNYSIPEGTVKGGLRKLREEKISSEKEGGTGRYGITFDKLQKIQKLLTNKKS